MNVAERYMRQRTYGELELVANEHYAKLILGHDGGSIETKLYENPPKEIIVAIENVVDQIFVMAKKNQIPKGVENDNP